MTSIAPTNSIYSFLFHPLEEGPRYRKILAVITNIALTILTLGLYLVMFGVVHLFENKAIEVMKPQTSKLSHLIEKQRLHLEKLKALASKGQWQHLQTHTSHPDSGFDWWMFPIYRPSSAYQDKYSVTPEQVTELKKNSEFIRHYREGVILVAKSWGWDLETGNDITNAKQRWTDYQVRLGKMLDSLKIFGQMDLHKRLVHCIDQNNLRSTLAPWIQKLLA